MRYQQALDYLYSQLPMYQRQGKVAFKKDLSNTIALCKALGNPQHTFRSIHIAGTNGKGSTTHMIAAALQANGLKVGMYTSPHYKDFRERIKVNGKMISKRAVVSFVKSTSDFVVDIQPSFFELTVAMAFDHFRKEKVDIAVIETGLGGRLDSTNIISPLISVITNIGYDHQEMLGETLELIAGEKAGIIKPRTPVVIGFNQPEISHVFQSKADQSKSDLFKAWEIISCDIDRVELPYSHLHYRDFNLTEKGNIRLPSVAPYNYQNLKTALATLSILQSKGILALHQKRVEEGLSNFSNLTQYLGRWQIKSQAPLIILDAAHNQDGLSILFDAVKIDDLTSLHIVFGVVKDKSLSQILPLLPKTAKYYFCKPNVPRGLNADLLRNQAEGLKGKVYTTVRRAMAAAKQSADDCDLIIACGSSFVVAELV